MVASPKRTPSLALRVAAGIVSLPQLLVVEYKLARIQQRPEDILQGLFLVVLFGDQCVQILDLVFSGPACQTANVQLFDNLRG